MRSIEGHCHLNPDGGAPPKSAFDKLAFCCWHFWTIDVAVGSNIGIPILSELSNRSCYEVNGGGPKLRDEIFQTITAGLHKV